MKTTTLLVVSAMIGCAGSLPAQATASRFGGALPPWVDVALSQSGFWQRYDLTSRTSPEIEYGDLDDDGLWDAAIAIVDNGGRRRGIAVIHQIDRSVYIIGAGQPIGNGSAEVPNSARGSIDRLLDHHYGIRVVLWHGAGWVVWNRQSYVWVPDVN